MASSRGRVLSHTSGLFSIREDDDEEDEDSDVMSFLAESQDEDERWGALGREGTVGAESPGAGDIPSTFFQSVKSPVQRKVITEVGDEVKAAHEALAMCLYEPEGLISVEHGEVGEVDGEYRWTPSGEELERACGKAGDVGNEEPRVERRDSKAMQRAIVRMRGGGIQEFFGLKSKVGASSTSSAPRGPQIISRPSDAFSQVPGQETASSAMGLTTRPQADRTTPTRVRGLRVPRRLQSSFISDNGNGIGSFGGISRVASIVPEGSVASFYLGHQSRPETQYELDGEKKTDGLSVSPIQEGVERSSGELSPSRINQGGTTAQNVPSAVELPTIQLHDGKNHEGRTNRPPPGIRSQMDAKEHIPSAKKGGNSRQIPKLGSPMESPAKDNWRNFSRPPTFSSFFDKEDKWGALSPPSESAQSQRTFFGLDEQEEEPARWRTPEQSNATPPFRRQVPTSEPGPSGTDTTLRPPESNHPPGNELENNRLTVGPRNHSIWDGGDHLSIMPGESPSEIGALRDLQDNTRRRNEERLVPGGGRDELAQERAKSLSEDQFREKLLYMWNTHQTRMKLINEDPLKTADEKKAAAKDEQRYLELQIGQASTDTGFERLHEPWQKDAIINSFFGVQPTPSKTPSFLRKTNKVMKWILAVPDDPELKTHSSRKQRGRYSTRNTGPSNLQRSKTGASNSSRGGPSRHQVLPLNVGEQYRKARKDNEPRSADGRRQFHFAPAPVARTQPKYQPSFDTVESSSEAMSGQVEAGKMSFAASTVSGATGWPTQSQFGGGK